MSQGGVNDVENSNPQIATQFDEDSGSAIPVANVLNVLGGDGITTSGSGNTVTITADGGSDTATSNYIVDPSDVKSDYSTIQSALDAAPAGSTIFVKEGTYTEALTISKNVTITAFPQSDRQINPNVIIKGTSGNPAFTKDVGIELEVTNVQLSTNGANIVNNTGGPIAFVDCRVTMENGVTTFTNSAGGISLNRCNMSGGATTTAKFLDNSGTGITWMTDCWLEMGANTPSTISAGSLQIFNCKIYLNKFTTSGAGLIVATQSNFGDIDNPGAFTYITTAGTGTTILSKCYIATLTATSISVGAGTTVQITNSTIESSNAAVIDGAGTLQSGGLTFNGSSSTITTTTQTVLSEGPNRILSGTGHLTIPLGTTGQRPSTPTEGMTRGNSTTNNLEYYDGTSWVAVSFSSLTAGSVAFSDGTTLTEDNANFFWDDTNNRLGLGTATPLDTLHISGAMELDHTAAENDDHALEIVCDANGFTDVKAVDIDFITGAMAAGEDEEAILVNIDESASTGGIMAGYLVLTTTEGSATVNGYETGIGINPVVHQSGTFGDADSILNKLVDVTAALASGGAGAISIFVADNDTLTIGDAAQWGEHEIILATGASGAGVAPTFEYSTGGAGFSSFSPADGTNGFRNSGAILWDASSLAGWATATSGFYEVRITRTRNSLSTTPIIDELQISALTEYTWDKDGDVVVKSLVLTDDLVVAHGGTGASTFTDNAVLRGQVAAAIDPSGVLIDDSDNMSGITALTAEGDVTFSRSAIGAATELTLQNTDNTNVASHARMTITNGGGSGGDSVLRWSKTGAISYSMGIDVTTGLLKINNGSTLSSGTNLLTMTSAGEQTMPLQPAFNAYANAQITNVSGDNTVYTVIFNTERFDQNADYDATTGIFTAPVTGIYNFSCSVQLGYPTAQTIATMSLVTTLETYLLFSADGGAMRGSDAKLTMSGSMTVDMTATNTARINIQVLGASKDADIEADTSHYSGFLVC